MASEERVCAVCGESRMRDSDRHTLIGWVCEDCFPKYKIIQTKLKLHYNEAVTRNVHQAIANTFP